MKRKSSASPVCYADEPGIAKGYMWAQPEKKRKDVAKKPRRKIPRKQKGN